MVESRRHDRGHRGAGGSRAAGAGLAAGRATRRSCRAGSASPSGSRCSTGEGVGQKRRQHGHWGKKPSEVDQEMTAFEPERRLAWRHLAERLDGKPAPRFAASTDFSIELAPAPAGTRVTAALGAGAGEPGARAGDARVRAPRAGGHAQPLARRARARAQVNAGVGAVDAHGGQPVQADGLDQRADVRLRMREPQRHAARAQPLREARQVDHQRRIGERQPATDPRSRHAWRSGPRRTAGGGGRSSSGPRPPRSGGSRARASKLTMPATVQRTARFVQVTNAGVPTLDGDDRRRRRPRGALQRRSIRSSGSTSSSSAWSTASRSTAAP